MADTQWRTGSNAGGQPASCATAIIDALNSEFIQHQCKFVIQAGDLVDSESVSGVRTLQTRAAHAQALYNQGIGFFPVRGNHEASKDAALEMRTLFPQNQGLGLNVFSAAGFDSPVMPSTGGDPSGQRLKGLSYRFVYRNVRCVLIDQFTRADGTGTDANANVLDQVAWVDATLDDKPADQHGFVFAHKNLHGQNHKDVLFGSSLTSNVSARDNFIRVLHSSGVRYFMSGHDHMHHRSVVETTAGDYRVGQVICSSNSYKFYTPASPYMTWERPVGQELFTIGYYIVTVDGPRLTVDFYSSSHGQDYGDFDLVTPPGVFNFYLRETFGYSLNGREFRIARGGAYTPVSDSYQGTSACILDGVNTDTHSSADGRQLIKTVNTGWSDPDSAALASNVLSLWGMADNLSLFNGSLTGLLPAGSGSRTGSPFTLSLSYDTKKVRPSQLASGRLTLAGRNAAGLWVNAVDSNATGGKTFKYGPWRPGYPLGCHGVDPTTGTVWAVVDHDGEFAANLA
jgi:hypothetical protein